MEKTKTKTRNPALRKKAKATSKITNAASKKARPRTDRSAEARFHRFLNLWNAHIREQIKIHQLILKGKESLKAHIRHTETAHKRFLGQLKKI